MHNSSCGIWWFISLFLSLPQASLQTCSHMHAIMYIYIFRIYSLDHRLLLYVNAVVHNIMLNHIALAHTPLVSLFVRRRVPLVAMHYIDISPASSLIVISKEYGLVAIHILQTKLVQNYVILCIIILFRTLLRRIPRASHSSSV